MHTYTQMDERIGSDEWSIRIYIRKNGIKKGETKMETKLGTMVMVFIEKKTEKIIIP